MIVISEVEEKRFHESLQKRGVWDEPISETKEYQSRYQSRSKSRSKERNKIGSPNTKTKNGRVGSIGKSEEREVPAEYLMAASMTPRDPLSSPSGLSGVSSNIPTLPEFRKIKDIAEIYSAFT